LEDASQEEVANEADQTNPLDGLSPLASSDQNGVSGADTIANEADLDGTGSDFVFESFKENVIASGIANQEVATASLLSLSRLTGYASGESEDSIAELSRYAIASIAYDARQLWSQLDELETSFDAEFGEVSYSLGAVSAFGAAGYILWTLRGGQ